MKMQEEDSNQAVVFLALKELRAEDVDGDIEMNEIPWDDHDDTLNSDEGLGVLVVIDTNVLISYLPILEQFTTLLLSLPHSSTSQLPTLIIPRLVVQELDGLKNSDKITETSSLTQAISISSNELGATDRRTQKTIGALSRQATAWILKVYPSPTSTSSTATITVNSTMRSVVRGQKREETIVGGDGDENNDDKILNCGRFYLEKEKRKVVLLSNDKNLCLKARVEGVPTLSLDDTFSATKLLYQIDPSIQIPTSSSSSSSAKPRPKLPSIHSSPVRSFSSTSSHNTTMSPHLLLPLPPPSPQSSQSMEITLLHPPSFHPCPPPLLHPLHSPLSLLLNIELIIHQFLALPLAQHLFHYLESKSPEQGRVEEEEEEDPWEWHEEIRNWSTWDLVRMIEIVEKYWRRGGLEEVCRKVLEKIQVTNSLGTLTLTPAISSSLIEKSRVSNAGGRRQSDSRISRWATPSPRTSHPPPPPPLPTKSRSTPTPSPSSKPSISPSKRLEALYSTLPQLLKTLSTPTEEILKFSQVRFEIVLERLEEFLSVLLIGLMGVDLSVEVREIGKEWESGLKKVFEERMR